jgi:hypothetical protein
MLGGLFVAFGSWRAVFWAFGLRGAITAAAARIILPAAEPADGTKAIAWRRLSLIGIGIARIAIADLAGDFASLAGLAILGACTFLLALRQDSRSGVRLFSRGSGDPRTIHGAGYATLFLFYVASMGLTVYGPAVLQTLRGLSPLAAGYVVGAEALFWAAASLPMAGLTGRWGAVALFVGLACCAIVFDDGNLAWVVLAGGLVGVGSGLSYAFIGQGILSALSSDERATGGAGIATVRLTGAAVVQPLPRRSPIWPGSRTGFRCQRQGWLVSGCFLPRCRSRRWPALAPGTRVGRAPSVPSPQLY